MKRRSINRSLLPLLVTLIGGALAAPEIAHAQQAQQDDEIIERVVVRNRKHSVWNTLELSPSFGVSLINRMTQQYNLQLGVGFNFSEEWGLDVRGGWSLGQLSSVAESARARREGDGREVKPVDEFQDLWRMTWQAMLLPRWSPIYGKLNIVTELPVHFQAYLTAGGGMVGLESESIVYCQSSGASSCTGYLTEERQSFAAAAGLGLRFFVAQGLGLRLELLNMMYPDEYRADIDIRTAVQEAPGSDPQEGTVTGSGLTNVLFLNVGATLNF